VTERKRKTAPAVDQPGPEPGPQPAAEETQRGLHGWVGLIIRICVYMTAALCAELLLRAFEHWTDEDQ
jgi:hypothetical protein